MILLHLFSLCLGTTFYVSPTSSGTTCDFSSTPCSLPSAINLAGLGDVIRLLPGTIEVTNTISKSTGAWTLAGVTNDPTQSVLSINSTAVGFSLTAPSVVIANLTITASSMIQGGAFLFSGTSGTSLSAKFENVRFLSAQYSSGPSLVRIEAYDDGQNIRFENCLFQDNRITERSDGRGGIVDLSGGRVTFRGCSFLENSVEGSTGSLSGHGGAFHMSPPTLGPPPPANMSVTFDKCLFRKNKATDTDGAGRGGALYVSGDPMTSSTLSITSSRFEQNSCEDDGGCVWTSNLNDFSMVEAVFENNISTGTSTANGGAINLSLGTTVSWSDITFRGNSAQEGGAVSFNRGGYGTITRVFFLNNSLTTASLRGGAIATRNPDIAGKLYQLTDGRMRF